MKYKEILNILLLSTIIFLFTFPLFEPTYSTGIDPSIAWVYNYFFHSNLSITQNIIFPHGPFAFLRSPITLGNNLIWATIIFSTFKFFSIFIFLYLSHLKNKTKWLLDFFIVFLFSLFFYIDFIIISLVAGTLLIYNHHLSFKINHSKSKILWLVLSGFIAIVGFYIKSSIGIISLLILFSYCFIKFFGLFDETYKEIDSRQLSTVNRKYNFKIPIYVAITVVFSFLLIWFLLYHNFNMMFVYLYGNLQLVTDNSSAVSIYTKNNWIVLFSCIAIFFILPFTFKNNKNVWFIYSIFILAIFASWKYGMSREDISHTRATLLMIMVFFAYLFIIINKFKQFHIFLLFLIMLLFFRNMRNTYNYNPYVIHVFGINNFCDLIFDYKNIVTKSNAESELSISGNKLSREMREIIADKSVDIYPWDYTYIAANSLNWKPRPVLQSYASYTPWLDRQNAEHFNKPDAPEYIIWELINDWSGEMSSIDNKYLLNDEPYTLNSIFNNYKLLKKDNKILLFEKTDKKILDEPKIIKSEISHWNTWINVPNTKNDILKVRLKFNSNILRFFKTQLYKDEEFFIEYKLETGDIKKIRFVPLTATTGIWINPMILYPSNDFTEPLVKEIRFTSSHNFLMKNKIKLDWELTHLNSNRTAFSLFGKNKQTKEIACFLNDMEKQYPYWYGDLKNITDKEYFSGLKSYCLNSDNTFSPTLTLKLDELIKDTTSNTLILNASVWFKFIKGSNAKLVITVEDNHNKPDWFGVKLQDYIIDNKNGWAKTFYNKVINLHQYKNSLIKVYVWNPDKEELFIDDFKLILNY